MKDEDIIKRFEEFHTRAKSYCDPLHREYVADKRFALLDEQWEKEEKQERGPGRHTLTINRLRQHIMKVVNDIKQSRIGIKVLPRDDGADVILAGVRQGIIRSIERNGGGQYCYGLAALDQVTGGLGGWRLVTEYADPMSFDQDIKFKPIEDMTTVIFEASQQPDYSDMTDLIIQEKYTKARFKTELKLDPDTFLGSDTHAAWGGSTGPTVSEYWFKEEAPATLVKGIDDKSYYLDDLKAIAKSQGVDVEQLIATDEDGNQITREATRCQVWWTKLAGKRVLKKQKWLGYWIPVFIINGRKTVVEDTVRIDGLVRPAKDSQKAYNYARSARIERLALSPKAPWLTPVGSIPANEKNKWNTANTRNWSHLSYNQFDEKGRPLNMPKRQDPAQSDPGFLQEEAASVDEIKATLGMYDNSLGNREGDQSGRAIIALQRQGDNATYDFQDCLAFGVKHCGRVLNEILPKIYDTKRQVRMVGEDEQDKVVMVNTQAQNEKGEDYYYDLKVGKFDIDVETGPSASTKREETRESLQAFIQAFPPAAPILGDLYAKENDWRFADEVATRLKKFIATQYPGIIEEDKGEKAPDPRLLQAMQQMEQLQAALADLQQQNQQLTTDKSLEAMKLQMEQVKIEMEQQKLVIEEYRAQTERIKVQADIEGKVLPAQIKAEADQNIAAINADAQVTQAGISAMRAPNDNGSTGTPEPGSFME